MRALLRLMIFALSLFAFALYPGLTSSETSTFAHQGIDQNQLHIQIQPGSGPPGTEVQISGTGAPPGSAVVVLYAPFDDLDLCRDGREASVASETTADEFGRFQARHGADRQRGEWAGITYLAKTAGGATSNLECFTFVQLPGLPAPQEIEFFHSTGYEVGGAFLKYWRENGGLPVFGYPISAALQEQGLTVQYFERAVFELHPENPPPHNLLLRRLGAVLTEGREEPAFQWAQPVASPECVYFSETGHNLCGNFRSYWQQFGGLPVYGYPISEEFRVSRPATGEILMVQYFERQRFEWHPGEWPERYNVLLGRLGAQVLRLGLDEINEDPRSVGSLDSPARIELPLPGTEVTLPIHILVRVERPDMQVVASLRWQDGTILTDTFTTLRGEDGRGLLIENFDWERESRPPMPATQSATLELRDTKGGLLGNRQVTVLSAGDPGTSTIKLYWLLGEGPDTQLEEVQRSIPATRGVGSAALEELLWGPGPPNLAGFRTAIPTPEEVLAYSGRTTHWGPRVRLLDLKIDGGVATANFSRELQAYGGGSARVRAIREQITSTLAQFPTVNEVRIAIEGQTEGVLQP